MRLSGISARELSAAAEVGESRRRSAGLFGGQQRRRSSEDADPSRSPPQLGPPPSRAEDIAIDMASAMTAPQPVYRTADGEALPELKGWLRKKSKKRRSW
jgi:hypothetical protein